VNQNFPKEEKLKSSKAIERLFSKGQSIVRYPLKVVFLVNPETSVNRAAFSVPKRNFKHAVSRNKIKRQMRENYRLNKHLIAEDEKIKTDLLFVYLGKEMPKYQNLNEKMIALLKEVSRYASQSVDKNKAL